MVFKKNKIYKFNTEKRFKNPYRPEEKTKKLKQFFFLTAFFVAFVTTVYILLFHSFFRIKIIDIEGLNKINKNQIESAVLGSMSYKKFFVIPADNFFLVNVSNIKNILLSRFPFKNVTVEKSFPNKLYISSEEKISTIIYDNEINYSFIDLDGRVVEIIRNIGDDEFNIIKEIVTSTDSKTGEIIEEEKEVLKEHTINASEISIEIGDYPIIYDKRKTEVQINKNVLRPETIEGIINWYSFLNKNTNFGFGYAILENELGFFVIQTKEGWLIYTKIEDVEKRFSQLISLIEQKIENTNNLEYIDLRYDGRAYWKEKEL